MLTLPLHSSSTSPNVSAGPIDFAAMTSSNGSAWLPMILMRTGRWIRPSRIVASVTWSSWLPLAAMPPLLGSMSYSARPLLWSLCGSTSNLAGSLESFRIWNGILYGWRRKQSPKSRFSELTSILGTMHSAVTGNVWIASPTPGRSTIRDSLYFRIVLDVSSIEIRCFPIGRRVPEEGTRRNSFFGSSSTRTTNFMGISEVLVM